MAVSLDKSKASATFGENVTAVGVDAELVKLFTIEIIDILHLNDDPVMVDEIVQHLLEHGRDSLEKYEDDIIMRLYHEAMNGNDTKLMGSLKKHFVQQWETQYGSSHSWFTSFLNQYANGEDHDVYETVLIRTAKYGNKYMKNNPLLSIVLQLVFESIDDDCLQGTNSVFDDLWMAVTNDGLQSITKYSDYISKNQMNEQLKKESILSQALSEYYRPNVFSSLKESSIANKKNLYDFALHDVVEHGWKSDMRSIQDGVSPKCYRMLLEKLRSHYETHIPSVEENEKINVTPLPTVDPLVDQDQLDSSTVPVPNVTPMKKTSLDTKTVTESVNNIAAADMGDTNSQKDKNERDNDEADVSHALKTHPGQY